MVLKKRETICSTVLFIIQQQIFIHKAILFLCKLFGMLKDKALQYHKAENIQIGSDINFLLKVNCYLSNDEWKNCITICLHYSKI